tara:strand:+ start:2061 stop:2594 length:534 start_codon:yes stop_codon:yes gene_type:complete
MGYTTDFFGAFQLDKPLSNELKTFLTNFSDTRRMKRNVDMEYGIEGEFFVNGGGDSGQAIETNIVELNYPPRTQPGLWCQWTPNEDGTEIMWDGCEKFYHYTEWLNYIIHKFLKPNGYTLNGEVKFQGEDSIDSGRIVVKNNIVYIRDSIQEPNDYMEIDTVFSLMSQRNECDFPPC